MSNDPFIIEAPSPGSIFREVYISPHNLDIMSSDGTARKLHPDQVKKAEKLLRQLNDLLDRHQYDQNSEKWQSLKQYYNELKIARLSEEDEHQDKLLRREMYITRKRALKLAATLEPAKHAASVRNYIRRRLREHEQAVADEILSEKLKEQMKEEISYMGNQLINRLTALGYRQEIYHRNKKKVKKVKFEECHFTEDEIQFKVYVSSRSVFGTAKHHLPEGVNAWDLVKIETLRELSAACERPVTSPHTPREYGGEGMGFENGAWLVVARNGIEDGLFKYITLGALLARYDATRRTRFPLVVGMRRGRVMVYCHLDEHPHLIIDGQTFSGKTNAIVQAMCTLVQMHSPDELRLAIVDLKRGGDFNPFNDIPHIIKPPIQPADDEHMPNIIKTPEHLAQMLGRMVGVMYERMKRIGQVGAVDIRRYNQSVPEMLRLPRILVVIDEYAASGMDREAKQKIDHYSTILSTQARAAGIHLILGTQQPYADAIPRGVRANATFHLGGRQITMGASMSAFGSGTATKLEKRPGRMMCNDGMDIYEVQVPHATEEDIANAVKAAKDFPHPHYEIWGDGDTEEFIPYVKTLEERILEIAMREFDGELKSIRIWEVMADKNVSQKAVLTTVKEIASAGVLEYEGKTYDIVKKPGNFFALIETTELQSGSLGDMPIGQTEHQTTHETTEEVYT